MPRHATISLFIGFSLCILNVYPLAYAQLCPTLDQWADAIFQAEGRYKATYLYGIRSIKYKDEAEARRICKNTVYNTLVKYRAQRCEEGESDLDCLSRRYCPLNADNDSKGINKNWKKNVAYFLNK